MIVFLNAFFFNFFIIDESLISIHIKNYLDILYNIIFLFLSIVIKDFYYNVFLKNSIH